MPWIEHTANDTESMPKFNDSENIPALLPEGDYVFTVIGFECKISQGAKTRGSDQFEVEITIAPAGKRVIETLTDHPSCDWKIDTFLKSAGIKLAKGESFEFRKDMAEKSGVKWINPLGLRGWCRLFVEEYEKNGQKRKTNNVATFYTDKAKLEAVVIEVPEDEKPF
jgi:hypothetical protein